MAVEYLGMVTDIPSPRWFAFGGKTARGIASLSAGGCELDVIFPAEVPDHLAVRAGRCV
jgi:hypothetical protein